MAVSSRFCSVVASWVFAIEYLEIVLKGALIMRNDVVDLARKENRYKQIRYCLTSLFSLLLTAWLTYCLLQIISKKTSQYIDLHNVLSISSASVMIFSVIYLR